MSAPAYHYNPPNEPLKIIYQDDYVLVLSKPSGLLSVPGKHESHADCLENRAKTEFPDALLVHRLDMDTSGIFIMAMNKAVQGNLGKQFQRRKVSKTYIARVWGHIKDDNGEVDLPLICDWPNRPKQMVCYENGKSSQTSFEVINRDIDEQTGMKSTLVKLTPLTGRSHQLRVHMLELNSENGGHPILGDNLYAHDEALAAAPRLCLHAQSLTIHHPEDGRLITFTDEIEF